MMQIVLIIFVPIVSSTNVLQGGEVAEENRMENEDSDTSENTENHASSHVVENAEHGAEHAEEHSSAQPDPEAPDADNEDDSRVGAGADSEDDSRLGAGADSEAGVGADNASSSHPGADPEAALPGAGVAPDPEEDPAGGSSTPDVSADT
jgi:hypothetical protein